MNAQTRAALAAAAVMVAVACPRAQDTAAAAAAPSAAPPAVSEHMLQPLHLINEHTAGLLPRATYAIECRVYPSGEPQFTGCGLQLAIAVGVFDRLNIGISYGGDGLIGRGVDVHGNPYPGGFIKLRLFEERYVMPGIAIGYEHQGYGGIDERPGRDGFIYKSEGFFLVASKNFLLLRHFDLGFHGGVNMSMEEVDSTPWPDGFLGLDLGLGRAVALAAEYDLATNLRDPPSQWDPTRANWGNPLDGLLNIGVRLAFAHAFYVEALAEDILENRYNETTGHRIGWTRELRISYVNHF